jgi:hypothetical protein
VAHVHQGDFDVDLIVLAHAADNHVETFGFQRGANRRAGEVVAAAGGGRIADGEDGGGEGHERKSN